jgi:hypothetical protein
MTAERWQKATGLFQQLLEIDSGGWERHIDAVCGGDEVLRSDVERLLKHHVGASGFLETSLTALDAVRKAAGKETCFRSGDVVINRFRIVRFTGKGGMGEVYEAVDDAIGSVRVALKTIRSDMDMDDQFQAQLRREVQVARTVTHASVCRIYDLFDCLVYDPVLDEERKVLFLTMEFLAGESLADRLARLSPSTAGSVAFCARYRSRSGSSPRGGSHPSRPEVVQRHIITLRVRRNEGSVDRLRPRMPSRIQPC